MPDLLLLLVATILAYRLDVVNGYLADIKSQYSNSTAIQSSCGSVQWRSEASRIRIGQLRSEGARSGTG